MKSLKKIVIWGWGTNGKNLFDLLGTDSIAAIIEMNEKKRQEISYRNVPLISFEDYVESYKEYFIVVTPMLYHDIEKILLEKNISNYFILQKAEISLHGIFHLKRHFDVIKETLLKNIEICIELKEFYSYYLSCFLIEKGYIVRLISLGKEGKLKELIEYGYVPKEYEVFEIPKNALFVSDMEKKLKEEQLSYVLLNQIFLKKWKNDISQFRDIHKNKRMFIIATGPSLLIDDLEVLDTKKELTMSMNGIIYLLDKTKWTPNYYVASDGHMIKAIEDDENCERQLKDSQKFFSDNYLGIWDNITPNSTHHCFHQVQNAEKVEFSDDCSEKVYSGSTVVYACLQLAAYMGVKEIYLMGCDFSFTRNMDDPENHCYGIASKNYTFDFIRVENAYKVARKYAEDNGIKIYNATRGGKLEVFERVDFDTLF